eukprot:1973378-Amphidinium_carterae.1
MIYVLRTNTSTIQRCYTAGGLLIRSRKPFNMFSHSLFVIFSILRATMPNSANLETSFLGASIFCPRARNAKGKTKLNYKHEALDGLGKC